MPSNRALVAALACGAALSSGCGGLADGDYRGEPLAVVVGTLQDDQDPRTAPVSVAGDLSFALVWAPADDHDAILAGAAPVPRCPEVVPAAKPLCDGRAAQGSTRCDWTDGRPGSLLRVVDYQAHLPNGFEFAIHELPPEAAQYDLSRQGGLGSFALASAVAFDDVNRDGAFRLGTPEDPPDPTVANSGRQSYDPGPDQPRRSYLIAYLDGLIAPERIDPTFAEVLLFLPQGFSVWVEEEWLDGWGRTIASGRLWQPIDVPIQLVMPTQAVAGCTEGTRQTTYLADIPDGEEPSWCSDDRFQATWSRITTNGCLTVEERYSGDFACAGSLPPTWSCPAPTTGSLVVSVTATGPETDGDGYTVSLDGAWARAVGPAGSAYYPALPPRAYAVSLGGVAAHCSITSSNPVTATVVAGQTAIVSFSVACATTRIRLTTATTGADPDDDGYTVHVVGNQVSQDVAVGFNDSVVLDLGTDPAKQGTFVASLRGVARNCSAPGMSPEYRTFWVAVGRLNDVRFDVECRASGSLRVSAPTDGVDPDPNGYEVLVEGPNANERFAVPSNGSTAIPRLLPGEYRATLHGVAANCAAAQPVATSTVVSGSTTDVSFDVSCAPVTQLAYTQAFYTSEEDWDFMPVLDPFFPTEIFVVNSNGTGAANLTNHPAWDADPAWEPGGSRIAFTSDRDGNHEIYVMNADGSAPMRLTSHPAADSQPAWSPDGSRIAFVSERDGAAEIYVMAADGTGSTRLTTGGGASDPAWSPDGARVAFARTVDPYRTYLHVMNADGSGVHPLLSGADMRLDVEPDWSPDGLRIAFIRSLCDPTCFGRGWELRWAYADGSGGDIVVGGGDFADRGSPSWSPDALQIAYAELYRPDFDHYFSSVRVVRADGTGEAALVAWDAAQPAWRR